jgi:hypothetical protein
MIAAPGSFNGFGREPFNGRVIVQLHEQIDVAVGPGISACLRAEQDYPARLKIRDD